MKQSELEATFETRYKQLGKYELAQEHKFHPTRRWSFDFAHLEAKVAIELEGGVFSGGRHTRGVGYTKDCIKYNHAASFGWAVLRYTTQMINNDPAAAIAEIDALIADRLPVEQADAEEGANRSDPASEWWNNIHRMWSPVQPELTALAILSKPKPEPEEVAAQFAVNDMVVIEGYGHPIARRVTRIASVGDKTVYGVDIGGGCSWLCHADKLSLYAEPVELKEAS